MTGSNDDKAVVLQAAVSAIDASEAHNHRTRLMRMFWGWFTSDFAEGQSTEERDHYFMTMRSLTDILDAIEGVDSGIT